MKIAFIKQFGNEFIRPQDIIAKLMSTKQNLNEKECIQSLGIHLISLFKEYSNVSGKSLNEIDKIDFLINAVSPTMRENY